MEGALLPPGTAAVVWYVPSKNRTPRTFASTELPPILLSVMLFSYGIWTIRALMLYGSFVAPPAYDVLKVIVAPPMTISGYVSIITLDVSSAILRVIVS